MLNRAAWRSGRALATFFIVMLGLPYGVSAQEARPAPPPLSVESQSSSGTETGPPQSQPATANPSGASQTQPKATNDPPTVQSRSPKDSKHQQNDRIFFALPNYLTVEQSAVLPPLTTRQKFKTVAEGCFDPVEAVFIGIQAGIGQADDTNPTYGQGFVGYSKRFGTAYADAIIGNFGTGAIFPSLLRQDPRYYQRGKGNFLRRAGYAALRIVVTRSDSTGKTQFNFSELLGNSMAAGLANFYHPEPHTLASSAGVLGTQVVLDTLGYELKEFWPDIHRLLSHVHH